MRDERFEVSVTFDAERGYVASAPELRQPVVALSLGGLRRIEIAQCLMTSTWFCSLTVSPNASATAAGRWCAEPAVTRACIHKIAIGHSDLINVRFAPLC